MFGIRIDLAYSTPSFWKRTGYRWLFNAWAHRLDDDYGSMTRRRALHIGLRVFGFQADISTFSES
ncbi:MAG: hypothetical protein ACYTE8_00950 [Planctomycetota bacterium]|jgi:hypothetical protein